VSQALFWIIAIFGLLIAGLLLHFGEHIPLNLVLASSLASAVMLLFIGRFLKKRGILK
jgi:hypothetical protein